MDDLEQLVRETLHMQADSLQVPARPGEIELTNRDYFRRRLTWLAPVASAVAALIVAIVVVVLQRQAETSRHTPVAQSSVQGPAALPAGDRQLSYHGVTLAVPRRFLIGTFTCGFPRVANVDVVSGVLANCKRPASQSNAVTSIGLWPGAPQAFVSVATTSVTIGHHAARTGSGKASYPYAGVITVLALPDPGVTIVVAGPNQRSTLDALWPTIRIVSIDDLGCNEQQQDLIPRATQHFDAIVPAGVTSGVLCEYVNTGSGYWLYGSEPISVGRLREMTDYLNGLPRTQEEISLTAPMVVRYALKRSDGSAVNIVVGVDSAPFIATNGAVTVASVTPVDECYGFSGCPTSPVPYAYEGNS